MALPADRLVFLPDDKDNDEAHVCPCGKKIKAKLPVKVVETPNLGVSTSNYCEK
jgi:hypothetical protein